MRILIATLLLLMAPQFACANEGGLKLLKADVDLSDQASLQRGARLFVNYCGSCHSAAYMRYNRIGADLGISEELLKADLMFTTDKVGEPMRAAMPADDSKEWFGVTPPDLSVEARARGEDWLFSYLHGFYKDPSKTTGVNNLYFPGAAMPHVLWELQGVKRAVFSTHTSPEGMQTQVFEHFENEIPGTLDEVQYERATRDLVGFMVYMGEPAKLVRYALGVKVLGFLFIFFVAAYLLKREYWKDVN
ncbi:MAG: cytochrome c1 [Gammaproteobacteria bacterium]|nr:cytochrome c1 [Gammaproteobacteria bacterium]